MKLIVVLMVVLCVVGCGAEEPAAPVEVESPSLDTDLAELEELEQSLEEEFNFEEVEGLFD